MKVKDSTCEHKGKRDNYALEHSKLSCLSAGAQTRLKLWLSCVLLLCQLTSCLSMNSTEALKSGPRVLIVGSGAAAIAAITKLLDNGINNVSIIEASDRIGGRIHFVKTDHGGFDLGAHWVHGEKGNVVYEMAEPLDLLEHSCDFSHSLTFVRPDGTNVTWSDDINRQYVEEIHNNSNPESASSQTEYITRKFNRFRKKVGLSEEDADSVLRFTISFLCTLEGCASLDQVSSRDVQSYKTLEGDLQVMFKEEGYNNAIELLLRRHPKSVGPKIDIDDKIEFGKRVTNINWEGDEVIVLCEDGSEFRADIVIFTPSLGVLKDNYLSLFTPPLPEDKAKAIECLGMDVVDKIYLVYNEPWWSNETSGFAFLKYNTSTDPNDWEDDILGFFHQSSNPNALCAWLVGSGAKKMENDTDENVRRIADRAIRNYLGKRYSIPEPVAVLRSKWWTNRDIRGSYSFPAIEAEALEEPRLALARPLLNKAGKEVVLFAGEATHQHFYSTVHGAIETGWREANRIINMCNKRPVKSSL